MEIVLVCGARWNETRFCDGELDLVRTAGSSLDEQERAQAYHEIQRILVGRGSLVVPYFFAEHGVISDRFEGFQIRAFSGRTDLRPVHLSAEWAREREHATAPRAKEQVREETAHLGTPTSSFSHRPSEPALAWSSERRSPSHDR